MFWFRSLHQRQPILWKTWMHNTRKLKKTLTIQNDTGNNMREIAILWKKKIVKLGVKVFYSPSKLSDPPWCITPLQSSCLSLTWASILVSTNDVSFCLLFPRIKSGLSFLETKYLTYLAFAQVQRWSTCVKSTRVRVRLNKTIYLPDIISSRSKRFWKRLYILP